MNTIERKIKVRKLLRWIIPLGLIVLSFKMWPKVTTITLLIVFILFLISIAANNRD